MIIPFLQNSADVQAGQAEFEVLLRPHLDSLYRMAVRLTGHSQDAEDLVQELLVRLYRRKNKLLEVDVLGPWLKRALYNLFIDGRRKHARTPFASLENDLSDSVLENIKTAHGNPEINFFTLELQRNLSWALNCLGPEHRAIVVMHDMEGYSLVEASELLGIPLGTLKSRLFRARRRLRRLLEERNLLSSTDVSVSEALENGL